MNTSTVNEKLFRAKRVVESEKGKSSTHLERGELRLSLKLNKVILTDTARPSCINMLNLIFKFSTGEHRVLSRDFYRDMLQ